MIFSFTAKLVTLCIDMYGFFRTEGRLIGDCTIPEQNVFSLLSLPGIIQKALSIPYSFMYIFSVV